MEQARENFEKLMTAVGYMTQAEVVFTDAIRALFCIVLGKEPKGKYATSGIMLPEIEKRLGKLPDAICDEKDRFKICVDEAKVLVKERNKIVHSLLVIDLHSKAIVGKKGGEAKAVYTAKRVWEVRKICGAAGRSWMILSKYAWKLQGRRTFG